MEKQTKTGSPALGAETQEKPTEIGKDKARKFLEYDFMTARVFCHLIATDENCLKVVQGILQEKIAKNANATSEQVVAEIARVKIDATTAAALMKMVLESPLMLDALADVVNGLSINMYQLKKIREEMVTPGLYGMEQPN